MVRYYSPVSRLMLLILFFVASASSAAGNGLYLGQDAPGLTPEVFAPGIISVPGSAERSLSLSPAGDELFFARSNGWPYTRIMHMERNGDEWSMPVRVSFLQNDWATQPVFSPDGQYLYFSSSRGKADIRHYSLWRAKKEGGEWAEPENVIDMGGMPYMEFHPSVTRDGSIYFLYWDFNRQTGDIYVARLVDGQYTEPVNLGPPINTQYNEVRPTVEPDEKYLLFESNRPGGYGQTDIYISFKNDDGTWSSPRNLGPTVNTPSVDDTPNISPDGKYWFYKVNDDIYWMEARAALPDPNGPIENTTTGLCFGSIQCAINYADDDDTIVMSPGIYQESIDLTGKTISLQSVDPNDPFYIGGTIIQGNLNNPVITLQDNPVACQIAGLTISAGSIGIIGSATDATIRNCRIMDNTTHGLELSQGSSPNLQHCLIASNGRTGITMLAGPNRSTCKPNIENCIIVDNGQTAIDGGEPVIIDSVVSQ